MSRYTDTYTVTYIHAHFLPSTHKDIHNFTDTLRPFTFTGSHIHTLLYTTAHFHTQGPVRYSHVHSSFLPPLFHSHSRTRMQTQICRPRKSWLWCYPTSLPMPRIAAFLSGAHTHAKLAGRVTDWQARHQANQAGHSQKQDREGSRPPAWGEKGFFPTPAPSPRVRPGWPGPPCTGSHPREAAGAPGQA